MKYIGVLVLACGLLLAGCNLIRDPNGMKPPQSSFGNGEVYLFFNGEPIGAKEYVQKRSFEDLERLPEDMRYGIRRGLSDHDFDSLPLQKRLLFNISKNPNSNQTPKNSQGVNAYAFVQSMKPHSLKLLPEDYKLLLQQKLTKEYLLSIPLAKQSALGIKQ